MRFSKVNYFIGETIQVADRDIDSDEKLKKLCEMLKTKMLECEAKAKS